MNRDTDTLEIAGLPVFMERTECLMKWLQSLSFSEARSLWGCNEKIAVLNVERLAHMDLHKNLTPALLSYEGIQYQYMAPRVFEGRHWDYVQSHLRILSGFYGVLRPLDGVTPYRLEMQAKGAPSGYQDLYEFWGDFLYDAIAEEEKGTAEPLIVNLASKEYSRCIESYVKPPVRLVTCVFGEWQNGKAIQKGTMAKMARGEMVRFMAERGMECAEGLKDFGRLGYTYRAELSTDTNYVFIKGKTE